MGERQGSPEPVSSLDALRRLVEGTTSTRRPFFEALVLNLARSLGVRHAFVGELAPPRFDRTRTLAVAWDGAPAPNFEYALAGTPCEQVLRAGDLAYHPSGVAGRFPADAVLAQHGIEAYMGAPLLAADETRLGLLVVLHDRPLDEAREPGVVLRIFAARAAAELLALRSEERLRHGEETLRFALQAARMATFDWKLPGDGVVWSAGAAEILGVDPGALEGVEAYAARLHSDDRAAFLDCVDEARDGRRDRIDVQYRIPLEGEGDRWIQQRGTVTRAPDGRGLRVRGVVADVTERHDLEERLGHSQRLDALGRLAGGIAHDFNNLLTVIRSFGELASGALPADHPAADLVAPIRDAADRAAALTRQLLIFARRQPMEPVVLDPVDLVRRLGRILQRVLGEPIRLELALASGAGHVRIDPGQLEQVLMNLAVNARDAMPRGGLLTIEVAPAELDAAGAAARELAAGEYVRIRVADSGVGMEPEVAARAFEAFFTTKGPDRGTGLGLATSREIVLQAGGAIGIETAPGQGTSVTLLLPRSTAVPAEPPAGGPAPGSGQETVLLLEDDDAVRAVAARALRRLGYGVLAVRDAHEALRQATGVRAPVDVLVTDLILPELDGVEVARRLARVRPGVRVLFTSGHAGAVGVPPGAPFLAKPYTPGELAARLRQVLSVPPADLGAR